ncbi:MAG: tetratricopeptide repeat protein [Pirellulales bacterium]
MRVQRSRDTQLPPSGFRPVQRLVRTALASVAAGLAIFCLANPAWAQLTARDLVGKYVDVGVKHNDINQAITRFQAGATKEALDLLKSASKKDKELPPGQIMYAQLCLAANLPDALRSALQQAAAEVPTDPDAFIYLAELALREREVAEAEALYDKAVALTKNFSGNAKRKADFQTRIYNGLATIAETREKWDPATVYLGRLVDSQKEDPNPQSIQRLGRAQFQSKKYAEALASYKKAKELDKDGKLLVPEVAMGLLYEAAGDHQNAAKYMTEAAKAGAGDIATQIAVGEWALGTNQIDVGKQRADAALAIDPKDFRAKLLRGFVARLEKDYRTAKQQFEAAHLQDPSSFACLNQLALTLIELPDQGEKTRALLYAQLSAQAHPKQADAFSTLAWVSHRLGNNAQALDVLKRVAEAGGLTADGAYYAAKIYTELDKPDQAQRFLQLALEGNRLSTAYRKDAETLLAQLKTAPGAGAGAGAGALE